MVRPAAPTDLDALVALATDALVEYPDFAPAGWAPPSQMAERAAIAKLLDRVLVDERDGAVAGEIMLLAAAQAGHPVDDLALGHISQLFVHRDHWGTGVATALHDAVLERAHEEGMTTLRLFVATGQARARRFYEREGWAPRGEPWFDPIPGLEMIEYRRPL